MKNNIHLRFKSIQYKILVPYLILIMSALFITIAVTYKLSEGIITEKVGISSAKTLSQLNRQVSSLLNDLTSISYLFSYDEKISGFLREKNYNQSKLISDISQFDKISHYYTLPYSRFCFFTTILGINNKLFVSYENDGSKTEEFSEKILNSDWYRKMKKESQDSLWVPTHDSIQFQPGAENRYSISHVRSIIDTISGAHLGICMVSISEAAFEKLFNDALIGPGCEILMADKTGKIISAKDKTKLFTYIGGLTYFDKIENDGSGNFSWKINGIPSLVIFDTIDHTEWKIIEIIPQSLLFKDISRLRNMILLSLIITLMIAIGISYYISKNITNPVRKLAKTMREVENGNLKAVIEINSGDEIELLGHRFNDMMRRLNRLVDTIYAQQEEKQRILLQKKQEELDLLQAQINPHFLFNTLNSIKWMAIISQAVHVSNMIGALGSLLEMSISRGDKLITLDAEVDNLKNYIDLMKMRYNNKLEVSYHIDENTALAKVPRLILQPIAENSILHGFEGMEAVGEITVKSCQEQGGNLMLEICDNGKGMDEAKARNLLEKEGQRRGKFSNIGLRNVNERIKLHYGDNYGITIESSPGTGTCVKVVMPFDLGEEKGDSDKQGIDS